MKTRAAGFATHLLLVTVDAALLGSRIKDRQSAPRQAVIRAAGNVDLEAQPVVKAPSYQTRPCTVCVHLDGRTCYRLDWSENTTEGWVAIMWHGVDATAIHQEPKRNSSTYLAMFYVFFLIIGSLFILNLFVAVVIDTFYQEKEALSRTNDLTPT